MVTFHFLIQRAEASVARSNDLNPMVDVVADTENIQEKSVEFFKNFDVVCLNDYPADVQVGILYIGNDFLFLRYFLWDTHLYVKILLIYTASYNIKKNTT